jgi:hypothetical protein
MLVNTISVSMITSDYLGLPRRGLVERGRGGPICRKQPLPQPPLEPIHLSVVHFVIIPSQVERSVKDQLVDLALKVDACFRGVALRGLDGNDQVPQIFWIGQVIGAGLWRAALFLRVRCFVISKGEDVRWPVDSAVGAVEFSHPTIPDKDDLQGRLPVTNLVENPPGQLRRSRPIDGAVALAVEHLDGRRGDLLGPSRRAIRG